MSELRIDWPDASAEAVDAARARLRRAGRELATRSREAVVEVLGAVLERWRDPGSPERRELATRLPEATGFSRAGVEEGLARGFADWTADALRAAVARELAPIEEGGRSIASGFPMTSVLLAGSIPMPTVSSLLLPLVMQSPVLARSGGRDPLTARLVARSVSDIDPALGRCLEIVDFPSEDAAAMALFLDSECVVATGSDETLAQIGPSLHTTQRFVGYGHKLSVAVLTGAATSGEELERAAEGIALDTALWDQQGCLSPIAVFVEDPESEAAGRVGAALAEAMRAIEARLPRGDVAAREGAVFAAELGEAEMRAADGRAVRVHGDGRRAFAVVVEDTAVWRPAPLHRFLRLHPVTDRDALVAALGPVRRHLSAVAVGGLEGADCSDLARDLAMLGASRICRPGTLQSPPLGWHHDGRPLLLPLARIADLEP